MPRALRWSYRYPCRGVHLLMSEAPLGKQPHVGTSTHPDSLVRGSLGFLPQVEIARATLHKSHPCMWALVPAPRQGVLSWTLRRRAAREGSGLCGTTTWTASSVLCIGGPDVIRKEAWSFYRTISGVRLCWELEEPEGPKGGSAAEHQRIAISEEEKDDQAKFRLWKMQQRGDGAAE